MRKHERLIADVIATHESERDRAVLATLFSGPLSRYNKRFDYDGFMRASRVTETIQGMEQVTNPVDSADFGRHPEDRDRI